MVLYCFFFFCFLFFFGSFSFFFYDSVFISVVDFESWYFLRIKLVKLETEFVFLVTLRCDLKTQFVVISIEG